MLDQEPIKTQVRTQAEDFSFDEEMKSLTVSRKDIGAVVGFVGLCRDEGGTLSALELEHYPSMAEAEIKRIGEQAIARFDLKGLKVIHRYGKILPGENIVLVIAASPHRQAAFGGANYMMDFLKTRAPFWKKEHLVDGQTGEWVDAKDLDDDALKRWD
ncbi:MAG: molybdenum cofactor biosynthesis protein MoaE [Salaquimonas sp.]